MAKVRPETENFQGDTDVPQDTPRLSAEEKAPTTEGEWAQAARTTLHQTTNIIKNGYGGNFEEWAKQLNPHAEINLQEDAKIYLDTWGEHALYSELAQKLLDLKKPAN